MTTTHLHANEGTQFPTTREMRTRALDLLAPLHYDTLVTYQRFEEVLGLHPGLNHRARSAVLRAGRDLLKEHNKKIVNVKNTGYRIIRSNEQRGVSQAQQRSARRKMRDALQTVTHIALENLTPKEVAEAMLEQARAAIQLSITKRLSRVKELPAKQDLHLPSSTKLVEMMRRKRA